MDVTGQLHSPAVLSLDKWIPDNNFIFLLPIVFRIYLFPFRCSLQSKMDMWSFCLSIWLSELSTFFFNSMSEDFTKIRWLILFLVSVNTNENWTWVSARMPSVTSEESRAQTQVSPCWICGGKKRANGAGFLPWALRINSINYYSNIQLSPSLIRGWCNVSTWDITTKGLISPHSKIKITCIQFNVKYNMWACSGSRTTLCKSMSSITRLSPLASEDGFV
jgi:hypothetical protein